MKQNKKLSAKSGLILRRISEGHSYGQIVDGNSDIKYPDIFKAAGEVLLLVECEEETLSYEKRIARVKRDHPNAYETYCLSYFLWGFWSLFGPRRGGRECSRTLKTEQNWYYR